MNKTDYSPREPTEFEKKMAAKAVEDMRAQEKEKQKLKLTWSSKSVQVIEDQIKERKSKNLPNDWKVRFLESKLKAKKSLINNLRKAIK